MGECCMLAHDFTQSVKFLLGDTELIAQGSEAKIHRGKFLKRPAIFKQRFCKQYRHPDLDASLSTDRMRSEVRALIKCHEIGINCPIVYFVDLQSRCIVMELIDCSITVKEFIGNCTEITEPVMRVLMQLATQIGRDVATMHKNDLVHGDLTTSNILIRYEKREEIHANTEFDLRYIDFGLSRKNVTYEDRAVDLYVLERALLSTHPEAEVLMKTIIKSYFKTLGKMKDAVKSKLDDVRQRGRKRCMMG